MAVMSEKEVQNWVTARIGDLGWEVVDGEALPRPTDEVLIVEDVVAAIRRLNPDVGDNMDRVEQVMSRLRAVLVSVVNDGLVAANEELVAWLRGHRTVRFVGEERDTPIRLIDFDEPRANRLRVSTEVTYEIGREHRRYDIVLWVNGFPVVVGEMKAPDLSWLNGAVDISDGYEPRTPMFFVPSILNFASEGKELRYGAVCQPPEMWLPWFDTRDELMQPDLLTVGRSIELLLSPERLLDILRTYTLFGRRRTAQGASAIKLIPRYPQVEAVEAIVARCLDPTKRQGLVWHHQGSGKTLLMAFAAAKLRQQDALEAPTIVVVLDRLNLIEQTQAEFASVGIPQLKIAQNKDQLRTLLREDARGVIVTTIFRFADAGLLNERDNIVVMVDEAHRTQEGRLGLDMREALPNARFIGLTGTPISTDDRNTWQTFGDLTDENGVLNHYSVERSIADGATLPIHVETRLIDYAFDREALEEAFTALADEQGLDDKERDFLARKAARAEHVVRDPDRVKAVCSDIVTHYRERIGPLGLKAQVVAYDRAACAAYFDAISELLVEGEECAVVMTTGKGDPVEWSKWDLDREQEAALIDRFNDVRDPLKFLIVTAKLLTGFDAPIEGVMYLDKPLRAHTLFQAVCRTNRRWTNPDSGQEKLHGLVVDYVGMGTELAKAVAVKPKPGKVRDDATVEVLLVELAESVEALMQRFASIDRSRAELDQIFDALQLIPTKQDREDFAADFLLCEGLFEFLWPDSALRPIEADYKWLARVYEAFRPNDSPNRLLWRRLGAKTVAIVHEHLTNVTVNRDELERIAVDADVFDALRQLDLFPPDPKPGMPMPTASEIVARLEERIRRKLEGSTEGGKKVWQSLADRLELLRNERIQTATASVEFLKMLLALAQDVLRAERADADGTIESIVVVDPRRGALSQILEEYAPPGVPVMVETVVEKIDELVQPVRGSGWQSSSPGDREVRREIRLVLKNAGLPITGELYDRTYAYIRENY
jgi:type I restriction enzyme R subunit